MESRYRQYVYEIASFFLPLIRKYVSYLSSAFFAIPTRPPIVGYEVPHTHTVPMWADLANTAQGEPLGK